VIDDGGAEAIYDKQVGVLPVMGKQGRQGVDPGLDVESWRSPQVLEDPVVSEEWSFNLDELKWLSKWTRTSSRAFSTVRPDMPPS